MLKNFIPIRKAVTCLTLPVWLCGIIGTPALRADNKHDVSSITTTPIQHVVIIFQENVSFDHYFGTYPKAANLGTPGEPVFNAKDDTPSVNGLMNAGLIGNNPNLNQPQRLSKAQAVTCDQDHNYNDEQKAFHGGLMDQFVQTLSGSACTDKSIVMDYYDGNTVTAMWNYAQNFAMSDNSFSTTFGPSSPGAVNLVSGQTHGAVLTLGTSNVAGGSLIGDARPPLALDDCTVSTSQAMMTGPNVGDLLNAKAITWGWFQGGFRPSSTNASGTATCATAHTNIAGASVVDYIPHHEPFQYYKSTSNLHHLPPSSVANIGKTDQANHQYDLSDFSAALNAGNLPAVSYLKAAAYQDGHASYSDPIDEQTFLVNTINSIEKSKFWDSTAIIILYDDSDGWYDHAMGPIVNQSSTTSDFLTGTSCGDGTKSFYQGRCGYGPRQPLLVISPWAKVNFVDHGVTDQSSTLKFIEDNWSLGQIGDHSTDAIAGSLLPMFDFDDKHDKAPALILDPSTGQPVGHGNGNGNGNGHD